MTNMTILGCSLHGAYFDGRQDDAACYQREEPPGRQQLAGGTRFYTRYICRVLSRTLVSIYMCVYSHT